MFKQMIFAIFVVLLLIPVAYAQDLDTSLLDGTLADQCGAVEYLVEIDRLRLQAYAKFTPSDPDNPTNAELGALYIAFMERRDAMLAMEGVPECADVVHGLIIRYINLRMDAIALAALSAISFGTNNLAVEAGRLLERSENVGLEIDEEFKKLGWLDANGERVLPEPEIEG